MQDLPIYLVPIVILAPVSVILVFSRYTGWNHLAEHYPAGGDVPRAAKWFGYGVFRGWVGYNGGIVVASNDRGLYLRGMPVLLSFCHRPIYIPWSDITRIEEESTWSGRVCQIRTRRAPQVQFALRPSTFAVVRENARAAGVPGDY
jgi:hypothetical protein